MASDPVAPRTPAQAEAAFYEAFERGSLRDMMHVWSSQSDVECVHPLGERLQGLESIRDSWRAIFRNTHGLRIRVAGRQVWEQAGLAVHVVHEHITLDDAAASPTPIVATNVYRLETDGWRMVLHHASPVRAAPSSGETPSPARLH